MALVGISSPADDKLLTTTLRCRSTPAIDEAVNAATIAQLRRRLADENTGRDGARLTAHRLKTVLSLYRQRLNSLLTRPGGRSMALALPAGDAGALQRVREVVRELEDEVRSACEDAQNGLLRATNAMALDAPVAGPVGNHEVLKRSLEEAQRRCESLNFDMMQHSEANGELVETLGTVKDANRRLLEQIRAQTDEIATLTQDRVDNEEKVDQMHRMHENARQMIRQDAQRKVLATREAADEKQHAMQQQLTDKIRQVKASSEILLQDAARLGQELVDERKAFVDLVGTTQVQLQGALKHLYMQCEAHLDTHGQKMKGTEDSLRDLEDQVRAEQDGRHSEGFALCHKHVALVTEREEIQSQGSREIAAHASHAQAAERAVNADKQSWAERRANLERKVDDLMQQRYVRDGAVERLQQQAVSLDSSVQAARSEVADYERTVFDLKRKARESNDALAAALSSNEHLREQMQEQRARFQQKNEEDLDESRQGFEKKAADAQQAHEANMVLSRKQLEAMGEEVCRHEDDAAQLQKQLEALDDEVAGHGRDHGAWRQQADNTKATRELQEKDFGAMRHRYHGERLKLQAALDKMTAACAGYEEDCKRLGADLPELRRAAVTREHEYATRHQTVGTQLKDAQDSLSTYQKKLKDASEQHARTREEITAVRERALEIQAALQNGLDSQANAGEQERQRLAGLFEAERASGELVRKELEKERDASEVSLRRLQDEGRSKLVGAAQQRQRVQEQGRADIAGTSQAIMQQQRRIDLLEHELERLRTVLAERDASLGRLRQVQDQEERGAAPAAIRRLEDEVRAASSALEAAQRSEKALAQRLDTHRRREERDRTQLGLARLGDAPTTAIARVNGSS